MIFYKLTLADHHVQRLFWCLACKCFQIYQHTSNHAFDLELQGIPKAIIIASQCSILRYAFNQSLTWCFNLIICNNLFITTLSKMTLAHHLFTVHELLKRYFRQ